MSHDERIFKMEQQIERLVSDAESEKEVRKRIIQQHEERIRELENYKSQQQGKDLVNGRIITLLLSIIAGLILWFITKN